jgi:RND family efflux transporter MFP subunit
LLQSQAATPAEFDAVTIPVPRGRSQPVSYASITAPFDGVVGQKLCEAGDLASPGKAHCSSSSNRPTFASKLKCTGAARQHAVAHSATPSQVSIDATGEKCDGAVAEIDPVGDPSSHTFLMKIDLLCKRALQSGMFGRAELPVGERPVLFVPITAVREQGQLTFIYVAADGRANLRLIKAGKQYADLIEVLSGLQPGEQVVVRADGELTDQQKITS